MSDNPTCEWEGASGQWYTYWVHPRHDSIKPGQMGNYIYARREAERWVPVYIGEGDLSVRCSHAHHQRNCIDTKDATHVHMHTNPKDATRNAEESDLLAAFPEAYAPNGCNVKLGG